MALSSRRVSTTLHIGDILGAFEEYRASLEKSRKWFNEAHPNVQQSFEVLNLGFDELSRCLQFGRDAKDKTHISLAPLLLICQRQAFVALEALSLRQAYQAWVLVRPGLESALFMGKWMEDLENYRIWERRGEDPKRYQRSYSGKALASTALPRSNAIQRSLRAINDTFVHPNPAYYTRHTRMTDVGDGKVKLELRFFDDDQVHWATILGMLHLLILTQDALAKMFAATFINLEILPDRYGLAQFETLHQDQASCAAADSVTADMIIHEFGLWNRKPSTPGV